jgi:hypothetical protein
MIDEDWVREAAGNDVMMAELLLLLKQPQPKTEGEGRWQ